MFSGKHIMNDKKVYNKKVGRVNVQAPHTALIAYLLSNGTLRGPPITTPARYLQTNPIKHEGCSIGGWVRASPTEVGLSNTNMHELVQDGGSRHIYT